MDTDRRNPYIILGVDYGADKSAAAVGFAQATRRIRNDPSGPFSLEDATWALHQVEQAAEDPSNSVGWYRVPADPEAYGFGAEEGILRPAPINLPRRSTDSTAAIRELQAEVLERHLSTAVSAAALPVDEIPALPVEARHRLSWGSRLAPVFAVLLVGVIGVLGVAVALELNDDDRAAPATEVQGAAADSDSTDASGQLVWAADSCVSVASQVARLVECPATEGYTVHSSLLDSAVPLSGDESDQLQYGLLLLGIDPGPDGDVSLGALIEASSTLRLPEGSTPRDVLLAVTVALDEAHASDPSAFTLRSRGSEHCGYLPHVVTVDGVYCLLPPG